MQIINKGKEPLSLTAWKKKHKGMRYSDLPAKERLDIREACLLEQFYLCAYCCSSIGESDQSCHNEHVESQDSAPNRTVDFFNIVASCNKSKQCGIAHKAQHLPLTPLMLECEVELKFYLNGLVEGLTDRAKEAIRVLNLGDKEQLNRSLIETRKQLVEALLYQQGENPGDIEILDDDLLEIIIQDLKVPENSRLMPFSPVLINILKGWQAA